MSVPLSGLPGLGVQDVHCTVPGGTIHVVVSGIGAPRRYAVQNLQNWPLAALPSLDGYMGSASPWCPANLFNEVPVAF